MAVSQLLARISSDRLSRCGQETDELGRLIGLEFDDTEDFIDVEWTPRGLLNAMSALEKPDTRELLERLFGKDDTPLVNKDHPDGPSRYDVYSSITYMDPSSVSQLVRELGVLTPDTVGAAVINTYEEGAGYPPGPPHYYAATFLELREFLEQASAKKQAVTAWWD